VARDTKYVCLGVSELLSK